MSESVFVPTTEVVRHYYVSGKSEDMYSASYMEHYEPEFDRWLAAEKAKWQAEALRAHRRRVFRFMPSGLVDRATVLADLDDYATRLEKGSDDER